MLTDYGPLYSVICDGRESVSCDCVTENIQYCITTVARTVVQYTVHFVKSIVYHGYTATGLHEPLRDCKFTHGRSLCFYSG